MRNRGVSVKDARSAIAKALLNGGSTVYTKNLDIVEVADELPSFRAGYYYQSAKQLRANWHNTKREWTLEYFVAKATELTKAGDIVRDLSDDSFSVLQEYLQYNETVLDMTVRDQVTFCCFILEAEGR